MTVFGLTELGVGEQGNHTPTMNFQEGPPPGGEGGKGWR